MKLLSLILIIVLSASSYGSWHTLKDLENEVYLYLPSSYQTAQSYPLMINLHGCAQKASTLKNYGNWQQAAEEFGTIIVIPEVPTVSLSGCWDYYGMNHTRNNRHSKFILSLVEIIKKQYSIDSDNIFISGLSSGGGLSMVLSCLAPDIFRGVGLSAAPSLGTQAYEINNATISLYEVKQNCLKLASSRKHFLSKQKVSIIYGDNDFIVDTDYNLLNAKTFASLYKVSQVKVIDLEFLLGTNLRGNGYVYLGKKNQERVSIISNKGIGHNWPAGQGGFNTNFVTQYSINYPHYLLKFLLQ